MALERDAMGLTSRAVIAAVDATPAAAAVTRVASVMARALGTSVRPLHVVPGTGPRGAAREAALARLLDGTDGETVGRPADVIAQLAAAPLVDLVVMGAPSSAAPSGHRGGGTAFAVARRSDRPLLLAPATADSWTGPGPVVVFLDGSAGAAVAAAAAVARYGGRSWQVTSVHLDGAEPARRPSAVERALERLAAAGAALSVAVWDRRRRGDQALAADLAARCPVPLLLVPAGYR